MALLPVTLRRRLRDSGFSEDQTDALDEASEATAEASREGMISDAKSNDPFNALRNDFLELRNDFLELRQELALLRADMNSMKWWLYGSLSLTILAATAAIIAAIAVWA